MSSDAQRETDTDHEEQVVEYLRANPDFLVRHPDLVETLDVPHLTGGASLLEHQVSVLRDKNRRYKRRLADYHEVAEDNVRLLRRFHRVFSLLLEARSSAEVIARTRETLCERFGCAEVAVALYAEEVPEGAVSLADTESREAFAKLREEPKAALGRLARRKRELLFGDQADAVGSVALAPLDEGGELGLLILASADEDTYQPGMGTLFVELLAVMLGERLKRFDDASAGARAEPVPSR